MCQGFGHPAAADIGQLADVLTTGNPETGTFPSTVYANMSPTPLPYRWEVDGDKVKITVSYGPLDATFHGAFSQGGQRFSGGWRPNPGADENVNVPYDIGGSRVT